LALAARVEYYSDQAEVIVSKGTPNGFQTFGYSLNMDIQVTEKVLWRVETRTIKSQKDAIFQDKTQAPTQQNYFIGTSLSIAFN
jgi:hypothetical protein